MIDETAGRPRCGLRIGSIVALVTLALALLTVAWIVRGAIVFEALGHDLLLRWQEVQTTLAGVDPNTLHAKALEWRAVRDSVPAPAAPFPLEFSLGHERQWAIGVYPPWSYVMGAPLHWPRSADAARALWLAIWCACFAATVAHVHRQARVATDRRTPPASLVVVAVTANAALSTDLAVGNYGLFVFALLLGMLAALQRDRPVVAGLLLGVAAIKPTMSLPFAIVFLGRRRWWIALPIALAVPVVGALVHWAITGTDPLASLRGSVRAVDKYASAGGGLARAVDEASQEFSAAWQTIASVAALLVALAVATMARQAPLTTRFAILAAASATWIYHRPYDYLLIGFIFLAVQGTFATRPRTATLAFALVGATVWIPYSFVGGVGTMWIRHTVWVGVALWLAVVTTPGAGTIRRNGAGAHLHSDARRR